MVVIKLNQSHQPNQTNKSGSSSRQLVSSNCILLLINIACLIFFTQRPLLLSPGPTANSISQSQNVATNTNNEHIQSTQSVNGVTPRATLEQWLHTHNHDPATTPPKCNFEPDSVPPNQWFSDLQPPPNPNFTLLSAWLKTESPSATSAPKDIPPMYQKEFSMDGRVPITEWYFNQAYLGQKALHSTWTTQVIENAIEDAKQRKITKYWNDGLKIHDGAMKYNSYIREKRGIVIGSEDPWVEGILLHHGAGKLLTVEFGTIDCEYDKIDTMVPKEFTERFLNGEVEQFDFGISFSSLEHDGLGRYGDVLNPIGDLQSMAKMLSVIKPGGLFFIAVPVEDGEDKLEFNANRRYGKLRLPLLMAGWKFVDVVFEPDQKDKYGMVQHLFVLQNRNGCSNDR